jgi:hypothetical protein
MTTSAFFSLASAAATWLVCSAWLIVSCLLLRRQLHHRAGRGSRFAGGAVRVRAARHVSLDFGLPISDGRQRTACGLFRTLAAMMAPCSVKA